MTSGDSSTVHAISTLRYNFFNLVHVLLIKLMVHGPRYRYEAIKIHDILTLLHVAINKLLEKSLSLLNSIYTVHAYFINKGAASWMTSCPVSTKQSELPLSNVGPKPPFAQVASRGGQVPPSTIVLRAQIPLANYLGVP